MPRIILDTDPGLDDALALLLALASPEITLEAITTVSGNVNVALTTRNALSLLALTGHAHIPVARGCAQPLTIPPVYAAHVHGDNGLGNVILPAPSIETVPQHAVDLIIEQVLAAPGEITLVPIGPLTNIAMALRREPRLAKAVREVVIMGGAARVPGNVTPAAEFNIYADPHAAEIVFQAGWPIRMVSLDVTTRTTMSREQVNDLTSGGGEVKAFIRQAMRFFFEERPQFSSQGFQMHDPLCLAAAFQPDLITWEPAHVAVELNGTLTRGATVAYFHTHHAPAPVNMQVSTGVDTEQFLRLYLERVNSTF